MARTSAALVLNIIGLVVLLLVTLFLAWLVWYFWNLRSKLMSNPGLYSTITPTGALWAAIVALIALIFVFIWAWLPLVGHAFDRNKTEDAVVRTGDVAEADLDQDDVDAAIVEAEEPSQAAAMRSPTRVAISDVDVVNDDPRKPDTRVTMQSIAGGENKVLSVKAIPKGAPSILVDPDVLPVVPALADRPVIMNPRRQTSSQLAEELAKAQIDEARASGKIPFNEDIKASVKIDTSVPGESERLVEVEALPGLPAKVRSNTPYPKKATDFADVPLVDTVDMKRMRSRSRIAELSGYRNGAAFERVTEQLYRKKNSFPAL